MSSRRVREGFLQEAELKLSFEIWERLNRERSQEGCFKGEKCMGKLVQKRKQQIPIFIRSKMKLNEIVD